MMVAVTASWLREDCWNVDRCVNPIQQVLYSEDMVSFEAGQCTVLDRSAGDLVVSQLIVSTATCSLSVGRRH